ncbi:mRNA-decapping enzyme subunit 1 [Trinorchestia longiramus]|nr:mRNA-decapping enzyme subunit 1 [Trinorchestia longiramus]
MEEFRDQLRLTTLRCVDPFATSVIAIASHTALYNYNESGETWIKTDVEGTLMIYIRDAKPCHMITIINRNSKSNFTEPITKNCDAQIKTPYILLRNDKMKILGVWFSEESDVPKIFQAIGNFIKLEEQQNTPVLPVNNSPSDQLPSQVTDSSQKNSVTSSSPENIMSMLSKAHGEYEIKKVDSTAEKKTSNSNTTGQGNCSASLILNFNNSSPVVHESSSTLPPQGTTVADFFAKVGVGLGPPMNVSGQHVSPQNKINGNVNILANKPNSNSANPVLQQLFQGAAAVGGQASVLDNSGVSRALSIPGSVPTIAENNRDTNLSKSGSMSLQELEGQLRKNLQVSAFPLTSEDDVSKRTAVGDKRTGVVKSPLLQQTFCLASMTGTDTLLSAAAPKRTSLEGIEGKAVIGSPNTHMSQVLCSPPGLNTSVQCNTSDVSVHENVSLTKEDILNKNDQDKLRLFQLQQQVHMQHLLKQQQLRVQQKQHEQQPQQQQQQPPQQQQHHQQQQLHHHQQQQQYPHQQQQHHKQQQPQLLLLEQQKTQLLTNNEGKKSLTPLSQSQFVMAMSHALTKEDFVQQLYQAYEEVVLKYNC